MSRTTCRPPKESRRVGDQRREEVRNERIFLRGHDELE